MSSLSTIKGFGMEELSVSAFNVLFDELNDELAAVEVEKVELDRQLAARRRARYEPILLERIEDENFHCGNRPSLATDDEPLESYPNCAVMAFQSRPAAQDDYDQGANYQDGIYVEVMVKASPEEGAETCNRRIWRTVDAANNVMLRNRTLGGSIEDIGGSPSAIISEVFKRPGQSDYGEDWFWQSGRIDYAPTKFSPFEN